MARPDNTTIKRLLSKHFSATRFSVSSGRGTSSCWTHVVWTDGPSTGRVEAFLCTIGATPGHMDQTDYYNGERISTNRKLSDAFRTRVATELLAPKAVPPMNVWHYDVKRPNMGGWYSLRDCIWEAASNRENFERAQFDAHAWMEAWAHNRKEAPSAVSYDTVGAL